MNFKKFWKNFTIFQISKFAMKSDFRSNSLTQTAHQGKVNSNNKCSCKVQLWFDAWYTQDTFKIHSSFECILVYC